MTEKTELYAALFFNVTGANVCLDSAKIDKPFDLDELKPLNNLKLKDILK